MIIVIPSIRNINLEYIQPLLDKGNRVIVVDDTDEERISVNHNDITILHYSDRKRLLGELESAIPKKNGVCRDFGLLAAYHMAKNDETIVCLDDDCQVFEDYEEKAEKSIGKLKLPIVSTKNRFYNLLDLYELEEEIFPRGFPYEERGKEKDYHYGNKVSGNVVFNLGLWRGVFDINAIDKLYLKAFSFTEVKLKYPQVIVGRGPLVSLCSMNMIMKREVIPAIYQLPMNEHIIPKWRIDRYGDIWGGYICKKLIDIKGDVLSVGEPLIFHHKDSNLHRNILQEHFSHIVNIKFCDLIDEVCKNIEPKNYLSMYDDLVSNLEKRIDFLPQDLEVYLVPTIHKMRSWVSALQIKDFKI